MPVDSEKAKEIFLSLVGNVPADEWETHVAAACGGDEALRQRVSELLRAHIEPGSFLNELVGPTAPEADESIAEHAGMHIGRYQLLRQIGEGGMGVVYQAEQQEPVYRQVALKIIKPGMDTRQVVARFEAERQALALMDHPNIAHMLDGGTTESGRPYFVMEMVDGIPITEYCDQKQLTVPERIQLFLSVCEAVQHAHHKGIIHRDLKPTNVLVAEQDGAPVPKVVDFGVAKAMGQGGMGEATATHPGQLVGTPLYMSPEQAEGSGRRVDTRSDIYSLGVVLYELLAGTTPFAKERFREVGYEAICAVIREEEPPRPSTRLETLDRGTATTISARRKTRLDELRHLLAGELDWIVMKAMEREPERRYASARELAEDLRRFLEDEPIQAKPPSWMDRAARWSRRHRALVRWSAAVLVLMGVGLAVSNVQIARQRNAAAAAAALEKRHREEAERERARAEQNFARARAAVDAYLTRVSENDLLDQPGLQPLRKDLLGLALRYYREFVAERGEDAGLQAELAAAYYRIGKIAAEISTQEEALEAYQAALAIRRRLAAADAKNAAYRYAVAETLNSLAAAQAKLGEPEQAKASVREAISILCGLTAGGVASVEQRSLLARAYRNLAQRCDKVAEREEALAAARNGLAIQRQLAAADPENWEFQYLFAGALSLVGNAVGVLRDNEQARAWSLEELEVLTKLVERKPSIPRYRSALASAWNNLACRTKDLKERLKLLEDAVQTQNQLVAENPSVTEYRNALALYWENLGDCRARLGRRDDAMTSYHKAIEIREQLVAENPTVPEYHFNLASAYRGLGYNEFGQSPQAEKQAEVRGKAVAVLERVVATNPTASQEQASLARCCALLSELQLEMGNRPAAITALKRQIVLLTQLCHKHGKRLEWTRSLAGAYLNLVAQHEDPDEAIKASEQAIEICRYGIAAYPSDKAFPIILTRTLVNVANVYERLGDLRKAVSVWRQNTDVQESFVKEDTRDADLEVLRVNKVVFLNTCRRVAYLQERLGQTEAAIATRRKVLADIKTWLAAEPEWDGIRDACCCQHVALAALLVKAGRAAEAAPIWKDALALWDGVPTGSFAIPTDETERSRLTAALRGRALVLAEMPEPDRDLRQALELARKAVEIDPQCGRPWGTWADICLAYYGPRAWQGAEEDARLALKLGKDLKRPDNLLSITLLFLLAGKKDDFREWCRKLLEKYGDTHSALLATTIASVCALDPQAGADPDKVVQLARRSLQGFAYHSGAALVHDAPSYGELRLGLAYVRAGDYRQALDWLEKSRRSAPYEPPSLRAAIRAGLAIVHARLGHTEEARKQLDEARQLRQIDPTEHWEEAGHRMQLAVLMSEAQSLIEGGARKSAAEAESKKGGAPTEKTDK